MTDLERIARILCTCDGYDPDVEVYSSPLPVNHKGLPYVPRDVEVLPQWVFYENYVRAVLTAVTDGADDTDLRTMITDILAGKDVPAAEEPAAPAAPVVVNWRDRYGLNAIT